jgi:hypothetical protein
LSPKTKHKRKTLLRPMDMAWQAFQAGAALAEGCDIDYLNTKFKAWWARHPQALPDGELKEET